MNKLRFFIIFIIGFVIYFYFDFVFFSLLQKEIAFLAKSRAIGHIFAYTITLVPLLITVGVLNKEYQKIPEELGLSKSFPTGVAFALLCTMPMLIAFAIKFNLDKNLSFDTIIINTISSAFFEEIIYRAFLFGLLFKYTRLGFLPSVFFGSLLFGTAHLYQSTEFNELIGIFSLTFLGSIIFAWIYVEWRFNLWAAIFLHCFMNLYWLIFNIDANALGGVYANIFRFSTIFLAIFGTILYKRKKKIPVEIVGKTWWINTTTTANKRSGHNRSPTFSDQ